LALLDEAHALDAPLVAGKAKAHFVEEPPLSHSDLEMPGKKDLDHAAGHLSAASGSNV